MGKYNLLGKVAFVGGSATVWGAVGSGARWRLMYAVITPATATGGCYALLKEVDSATTSNPFFSFGIASNTSAITLDFLTVDGYPATFTNSALKLVHNSSSTVYGVFYGEYL